MKTLCLLLLCLCTICSPAQHLNKDSLLRLLAHSREDTNRMILLQYLGSQYLVNNLDSSYYFGSRALNLSQRFQNRLGQATCLSLMASIMLQTGNYPEALRLNLQALQLAEQDRNEESIVKVLNSLGALYFDEKDYQRALDYFFESLRNDKNQPAWVKEALLANIGDAYLKLQKLDSGRQFSNAAYQLSSASNDFTEMANELANLGDIYSALKQNQLAHDNYRQALIMAARSFDVDNYCFCCMGIARLFADENRTDSALVFCYRCLSAARSSKITKHQLEACHFIEGIYESNKQIDSSLVYLKFTVALQDSLFSQEKSKQVQTMTLQENFRQRDLEFQKLQAKETAAKNIQLIAIALFIPIFFLVVVFLARVRVKARVIEFLAVVNLLLLFEFITDVAFPYISDWTHDSPAWEMLILVLIAALLEPINYRVERWVKVKLVRVLTSNDPSHLLIQQPDRRLENDNE